jgi:transposase InsO family protein
MLGWLDLPASKYYQWIERYGQRNEHNATLPKSHWLTDAERRAIVDYYHEHPEEGYRRLTYLLLDANVVAASPSSVYRVLVEKGLIRTRTAVSKKGTGFEQPRKPHENWHIDVSYLNIAGTFYYLCSVLDGCSRFLVHWEIRMSMTERDVETILQRAHERHPGVTPRIISDNGPQFIARDFKEFVRQ